MRNFFSMIGLCGLLGNVYAANDVVNTPTSNTLIQNTGISTTQDSLSKNWGLNNAEWDQYLKLMQGPSGQYYKNLSPVEVLGINAEGMIEMNHFAMIAAKQEHDKLDRELRFNSAFHEAVAKLYLTEPVIKPFDISTFTPKTD